MTSVSRAVRGPGAALRDAADWTLLLTAATAASWVSALLTGLERGRALIPAQPPFWELEAAHGHPWTGR